MKIDSFFNQNVINLLRLWNNFPFFDKTILFT